MATPVYSEDLTDITLAESTTDFNAFGGGGAGLSASPDLSMQGTNCIDKQVTNSEKGILYDTVTAPSMSAGDHTFIWLFVATPGLTDSLSARGVFCGIGNATTAFVKYHVEGNDTFGAQGRVGRCYPIDQTVTSANTGSIPYRTVVGSPNGTKDFFGGGINTTASVKGANFGLDAIRYGTGAYITAGDSGDPATFDGFAVQNDSILNRWGILTDLSGSYELQGRFVIGQNNSKTATLAYFEDSNVVISLADTVHSATDFTQFIIDHASTEVYWTNISISALGTNNPGRIVVNNASTVFEMTGCVYSDIGISTLRAGVDASLTTWRRTDLVTQNGATLDSCFFDNSPVAVAVLSDAPNLISNCSFVSDGSGHALELDTTGTYTFTGNTYSGYAVSDGSTGNETIYNNSGGAITLNISGGGSTPTIRNGSGATTTVNNTKTLTLTDIPSGVQVTIVNSSTRTELQNSTSIGANITYDHSGGETVDILLMGNDYDPNDSDIYDLTLPSTDSSIKFNVADDRNYDNP